MIKKLKGNGELIACVQGIRSIKGKDSSQMNHPDAINNSEVISLSLQKQIRRSWWGKSLWFEFRRHSSPGCTKCSAGASGRDLTARLWRDCWKESAGSSRQKGRARTSESIVQCLCTGCGKSESLWELSLLITPKVNCVSAHVHLPDNLC